MATRYNINDFALANPIYVGGTVSFYTVSGGAKTTTLATLYAASTGSTTLANPRTLDSDGKFSVPVYVEVPVIATVSGLTVADHDTGIMGLAEGAAATSAAAAAVSAAAAAVSAAAALVSENNAEAAAASIPSLPIPVASGGTGSTSATDARAALGLSIGTDVQAYDADTAKLDVDQAWTGAQRGTVTTDNDGSFDMNASNNFLCTPSAGFTLTFTNITAGQSGNIYLVNGSNYAVAAHANTKVTSSCLAAISATGEYWLSYYSPDGTNVLVSYAGDFA